MLHLRSAGSMGAWLALALAGLAPVAHAQYGNNGEVICESQDGRTQECRTPFRNPTVSQTLSSSPCIEGRTWGSRGPGNVWVTDGCRARFEEGRGGWSNAGGNGGNGGNAGYGSVVRCESNDGRTRECPTPRGARMEISRQLSDTRCDEGRNWGNRNGRVWVSQGCRAEFVVANGYGGGYQGGGYGQGGYGQGGYDQGGYGQGGTVVCESQDRRDSSCNWNGRWGRPQLLEQLSDDACREGYTWGYDGRGRIWVTRGCRGRFGGR